MTKSDTSPCPRDALPHQDDRPFKLPYSIPDNQKILFKRTNYRGGGARPRPRAKVENRVQTAGTDGRSNRLSVGPVACCNIWTGDKYTNMYCSRGSDSVDVQSETGTSMDTHNIMQNNSGKSTDIPAQNSCGRGTSTDIPAQNSCGRGTSADIPAQNSCGRGTSADIPSQNSCDSGTSADIPAQNSCDSGTSAQNSCGSRADHSRNNRIFDLFSRNRPKCQTLTAEHEMKAQYMLLKDQYGRVCEQEALLRNQMALLQAEIILMQTRAYHKSPAEVRRITIDPIPIRRARNKVRDIPSVNAMRKMAVKVDPVVSTGRYFTAKSAKASMDSKIPDIKKNEGSTVVKNTNLSSKKSTHDNKNLEAAKEGICYQTGDVLNRCFYFDIPLAVVAPPYTQAVTEKVTKHRLPKLPKIPTYKGAKGPKKIVVHMSQCQDGLE